MKASKLYFKSVDDEICYPLEHFTDEAKKDGLSEIELYEAIRETDPKFIFCTLTHEAGMREDCNKKSCDGYEPNKSGRGVCKHRGKCYEPGNIVTIKITIK